MTIEIIGVVSVAIGILCVCFGWKFSAFAFVISTLLGSAAATVLTSFGNANLPPANLLLLFLGTGLLLRPGMLSTLFSSMTGLRGGFWLFLTVAYGLVSALVMPRLFAGQVDVFVIGRTDAGDQTFLAVPLGPVSGNITQSVYFIGDLVCFLIFYTYGSLPSGLTVIGKALVVCAFVNCAFAGLDLATYWSGTSDSLGFLRNASYRMLDEVEISGLKRIVGSFAEASAFAYVTLMLLAVNLSMWLKHIFSPWTGIAALLSFVFILFTTSTTGYVGLGVLMIGFLIVGIYELFARRATRNSILFLVLAPGMAVALAVLITLSSPLRTTLDSLLEATIAGKLESQSGVERSSWNTQALVAIRDTDGMGAGLGSVRASSWLVAVPANLGVIGSFTFAVFLGAVFWRRRQPGDVGAASTHRHRARRGAASSAGTGAAIQAACRWGCFMSIVASSVAGGFVDLGLLFFLLAGAALSRPAASRRYAEAYQPVGLFAAGLGGPAVQL